MNYHGAWRLVKTLIMENIIHQNSRAWDATSLHEEPSE